MHTDYVLRLAHLNDTHSHLDPSRVQFKIDTQGREFDLHSHSGGYARISAQVKAARDAAQAQNQPFILLHGGDCFQGTLYYSQFKGRANAKLLKMLAPDAMVIGNHDIDDGNALLAGFIKEVGFPVLAANMDLSGEAEDKPGRLRGLANLYDLDTASGIGRSLIKPFHDKQLAIVGITLDQMKAIARPDPDTEFADAFATTRKTVEALRAKGIVHIIVLSHLGLEQDRLLAETIPGISLIVGGHTHTLMGDFRGFGLPCLPYGESVNGVPILHAGKHAETLGLADIQFDDAGRVTRLEGSNIFMLDSQFLLSGPQAATEADYQAAKAILEQHPGIHWDDNDEAMEQVIANEFRPAISSMENQVLALVPKALVHTRLPSRTLPHGSEIAPWVSRSMFLESRAKDQRVDFALHNAGGVRQSVPQGQLTKADVLGRLLPFELPLVKYEIAGEHLYQALESAINAATNNGVRGTGAGSFPYTYGLRYFYDGRKEQGERLLRLELLRANGLWQALAPEQHYIGVSTCYTSAGKEGYEPLLQARWQESMPSLTLPGAFINFLKKAPKLDELLLPHVHYTSHRAEAAGE